MQSGYGRLHEEIKQLREEKERLSDYYSHNAQEVGWVEDNERLQEENRKLQQKLKVTSDALRLHQSGSDYEAGQLHAEKVIGGEIKRLREENTAWRKGRDANRVVIDELRKENDTIQRLRRTEENNNLHFNGILKCLREEKEKLQQLVRGYEVTCNLHRLNVQKLQRDLDAVRGFSGITEAKKLQEEKAALQQQVRARDDDRISYRRDYQGLQEENKRLQEKNEKLKQQVCNRRAECFFRGTGSLEETNERLKEENRGLQRDISRLQQLVRDQEADCHDYCITSQRQHEKIIALQGGFAHKETGIKYKGEKILLVTGYQKFADQCGKHIRKLAEDFWSERFSRDAPS